MTDKRKIERITDILVGLDVKHMTTLELRIYEILKDQKATQKQSEQARTNTSSILDAGINEG